MREHKSQQMLPGVYNIIVSGHKKSKSLNFCNLILFLVFLGQYPVLSDKYIKS